MSEGQLLIDISRRAMAWPVQVDPCGFAGQLALELLFSVQSGRGAVRIAPLREGKPPRRILEASAKPDHETGIGSCAQRRSDCFEVSEADRTFLDGSVGPGPAAYAPNHAAEASESFVH